MQVFRALANLLEVTNNCITFYIYCLFSREFRNTFLNLFKGNKQTLANNRKRSARACGGGGTPGGGTPGGGGTRAGDSSNPTTTGGQGQAGQGQGGSNKLLIDKTNIEINSKFLTTTPLL